MTATVSVGHRAESKDLNLPSTFRLGINRSALEIKSFFRRKERVAFTFALPVVLQIIFGTIFSGKVAGTNVPYREYFTCGIIAVGIVTTTFTNLGMGIVFERDDGTLKRLAGTPMPKTAYFIGKAVSGLVVSVLETAILLVIGVAFLGLSVPHSPARWLTFAWVFVLGVAAFSLLGVAVSGLASNAQSAPIVFQFPYLVLSFISGVYFVYGSLPRVIQDVAAVFPLKWLCQGLRSVFLPGDFAQAEPAHSWQHGQVALVLAAWVVASLVVCVRTFRWQGRGEAG
jgi:ABC-2 type transport system permease protein